jgi:selT/selW/selH-like putative selenoprotein
VKGGGGIFDVTVDGKKVFSKFETHTFPDEDTLVRSLQSAPRR